MDATNQRHTHQAIVLLSGGIDSTQCARFFLDKGMRVDGIFIDYGQAAAVPERAAAHRVAKRMGIGLTHLTLKRSSRFGIGEITGRNAFLATSALFFSGATAAIYAMGIHAGTRYFDCSLPFVSRMSTLFRELTDGRSDFLAPFAALQKSDVFALFRGSGIDAGDTYSCEAGTLPVCGLCASCRDRVALGC